MIIYPAIDLRGGQCVRLVQGDFDRQTVYGDDPAAVAKRWQDYGAKWLHVVDLDGAKTGIPHNDPVARILEAVHIPVQLGGGNRTEADIEHRLRMGVSRVILGTAAVHDPDFTRAMAARYGDRIAVGVDALNGKVAVSGWQSVSETAVADLFAELRTMGIRTVIYTDIDRDGMMNGPNFAMYEAAARAALTIIASGGVSQMDDLARLAETGVSGAIIGKALYTGDIDLREAVRNYD